MRNLTLLLILFSIDVTFSQTKFEVLFDYDKSDIPTTMQTALKDFIEDLPLTMDHFQVLLKGHTDSDGNYNYNETLSAKRSAAVKRWLIAQGMNPGQIRLEYYGEYQPVSDNKADEGKAKNRRVEVYLDLNRHEKVSGIVPETPFATTSYEAENSLKYQYETSGTELMIPAGALVDSKGNPVTGKVDIHYREWRNLVDLLSFEGPMTYHENGVEKIFQSAGMFELQAFQNGEPVFLKPGMEATVNFIPERILPGVELYDLDADAGVWSKIENEDIIKQYNAASRWSQSSWYRAGSNKEIDLSDLGEDTVGAFTQSISYLFRLAKEADFYKKEKKYLTSYDIQKGAGSKKNQDFVFNDPHIYGEFYMKEKPTLAQINQLQLDNIKLKASGEDDFCYYFTIEDLSGVHIELNAFKGYLFAIKKSDTDVGYFEFSTADNSNGPTMKGCTESFWKECLINGKFCDIRISNKRNGETITCLVELKSVLGKNISFPMHLKQKNKWTDATTFKNVIQNYSNIRQNRDSMANVMRQTAIAFSHLLRAGDERNIPDYAWFEQFEYQRPEMLHKIEAVKNRIDEWKLEVIRDKVQAYNDWVCRGTNQLYGSTSESDSLAIASLTQSNDIMTRTPIRNFGIKNWDVVYSNYNSVVVNYKKEDGSPLQPSSVTIIDFEKKACVQTIYKNRINYATPANTGVMINHEGKVYYAAPSAFQACLSNDNSLVLTDITEASESKEKMKEVLGL
jgi:hypothetical protein